MNVLFIGPNRQLDIWGRKSNAFLNSLKKTDHSITSRPIFLSSDPNYNSYIEEAEFIKHDNYDILIQFVLESYTTYFGDFKKNIAFFNNDTFPNQTNVANLTGPLLMDEIWTENNELKHRFETILTPHKSNIKIKTIDPSLNLEELTETPSKRFRGPELENRFIFYYIGNPLDDKGGFKEALIAYLTTFSNQDLVSFMVVLEQQVADQEINKRLEEYASMVDSFRPRLSQPDVKVISPPQQALTTEERIAVHVDSDCMVCPNYSIGINPNVLEASLYQNTPIINKGSATYDWLGEENTWGIDCYEDFCITPNALRSRFTVGETWYRPISKAISTAMQSCYINKFERDKKRLANSQVRQRLQSLSYQAILDEVTI